MSDSPMRGWRVSGVAAASHLDTPTVEPLGGQESWPDGEITNGVAFIKIQAWGDDPAGAWVVVIGPDREASTATFGRVRDAIVGGAIRATFGGEP